MSADDNSIRLAGGDLVSTGGERFHVREVTDGNVIYWCPDVDREFAETMEDFKDRIRQGGNLILKPGEGRYPNEIENEYREVIRINGN